MDNSEARTLDFGAGRTARMARVSRPADLEAALGRLGLSRPRPVVVIVGGADGLDETEAALIEPALAGALLPIVTGTRAVVLDGGTDSGIMRLIGRLRATSRRRFPLLGVVAEQTTTLPGQPAGPAGTATLDVNHSHFLLVPGGEWGDEAPWMAQAATVLAGSCPSVTVLINGGTITLSDASRSLDQRRPVLVLADTGRTADRIAAAVGGDHRDGPASGIAGSPQVHVARAADAAAVREKLTKLLRPGRPAWVG